jgi:outer membrane protein OmpA-like peptidoglycan-associated protein
VPGGTTVTVPAAHVFGQSENEVGAKNMAIESIFRRTAVALVVGAYLLFVEGDPLGHAQTRVTAGSSIVGSEAPRVATAERVVLHGVRFRPRSEEIDKRSVPVLNYAVQIIKQNPESLIYVKVRPIQDTSQGYKGRSYKLADRRTRAVASYFEERGISANRLILLSSGSAPYTHDEDAYKAHGLHQNLEVVQLDLASGLD